MTTTKETNRVRPTARRAIVSAITAVGMGLSATACSGQVDTEPLSPGHGKETKSVGSKSAQAQAEDTSVDGGDEPSDGSEPTNGPNAKIPEVLYPNGVETKLTPPGTELPFGEPAIVASSDAEGRLLVWSVTPYQGVALAPEQVALTPAANAEGAREFVCFAYDIAYLGAVAGISGRDDVVPGATGESGAAVVPPELVPGTTDGEKTTRLVGGADDACGIPIASRLPVDQGNLALSFPYARATVAAVKPGTEEAARPVTLIYPFDYGIPGVLEADRVAEPIIWG